MLLSLVALKFAASKLLSGVVGRVFLLLSIAGPFVPLERIVPYRPKQRVFRTELVVDLLHFFVDGLAIIVLVHISYAFLPAVTAWAGIHLPSLSVKRLPVWEQFVVFEASWTFLGYWLHRVGHAWGPWWRLHSIHESSLELDWLAGFRLHPLEPWLYHLLTIVPLWFFQMSIPAVIAYQLYTYVLTHIQHANVDLPMGPLKYLFPSPAFHRWHHAKIFDASGKRIRNIKNFSAYPIWDLMFGTFYLPDERPLSYGNALDVPEDYLGQLAYPFGLHARVLAWKARFWARHPGLIRPSATARERVLPLVDAFESRVSRLALWPAPASPASALGGINSSEIVQEE